MTALEELLATLIARVERLTERLDAARIRSSGLSLFWVRFLRDEQLFFRLDLT